MVIKKTGSLIDSVNAQRNTEETLRKAIKCIVQLYSEKPHFIYELLQNAEDAGAHAIRFLQFKDRLEVCHDGVPFSERNLRGISDIGFSDKLPELNKIGKFGVGFKSVFTICKDVYLYSEPANYAGRDKGNFLPFAARIHDFINLEEIEQEPMPEGFTTRFVFNYAVGEDHSGFSSVEELTSTISRKLQDLGITTLLFMRNLESIEYAIDVGGTPLRGTYKLAKRQLSPNLTAVTASGLRGHEDVQDWFLKFSRPVRVEGTLRSVDIAFRVQREVPPAPKRGQKAAAKDSRTEAVWSFKRPENGCVSVYFPTGTVSCLNFIVQGPFRTTPNRSEVPSDDFQNQGLAREVGLLLNDALLELRDRGWLTIELINLLPIDKKVFKDHPLFVGLYDSLKTLLKEEQVFPGHEGGYLDKQEAFIARNNELPELFPALKLAKLVGGGTAHKWVSTKVKAFCDFDTLFSYLKKEIGIPVVEPEDFRDWYVKNPRFLEQQDDDWLSRFYALYAKLPTWFTVKGAASNMLTAPIVKVADGRFVAPYREGGSGKFVPCVFKPTSSRSGQSSTMVDPAVYRACREFFDDVLHLPVSNEYDAFVSEFITHCDSDTPLSDQDHVHDLKELLGYLESAAKGGEVKDLAHAHLKLWGLRGSKREFLRVADEHCRFFNSALGFTLPDYYARIPAKPFLVDESFYAQHGIEREELVRLGVKDSVVIGDDEVRGYDPKLGTWATLGAFRPNLMLDMLPDVLTAIEAKPAAEDSRAKSRAIFKSLLAHDKSLRGRVQVASGAMSYEFNSKVLDLLTVPTCQGRYFTRNWNGRWLYADDGRLVSPRDITRDHLDPELYGTIPDESPLYQYLGFALTKDEQEIAELEAIPEEARERFFDRMLLKMCGGNQDMVEAVRKYIAAGKSGKKVGKEDAFPETQVKSWDRLSLHAAERLATASPVLYETMSRRIRTSNRPELARAYVQGMYGTTGRKCACQLCHKMSTNVEAVQLTEKMDLELDPMHLCLCGNCAAKYKAIRHDPRESMSITRKFLTTERETIEKSTCVVIPAGDGELWFTPLHFAEIKLLFELRKEG